MMRHTPYGYDIVDGKAVINEEKAEQIWRICENYLGGMSFMAVAEDVDLSMSHCGVKRLIQNARYLGDEFYPAILTRETADQIEKERLRREKMLGRNDRVKKSLPEAKIYTGFTALKITQKFKDPIRQAEYAYSQIINELSS